MAVVGAQNVDRSSPSLLDLTSLLDLDPRLCLRSDVSISDTKCGFWISSIRRSTSLLVLLMLLPLFILCMLVPLFMLLTLSRLFLRDAANVCGRFCEFRGKSHSPLSDLGGGLAGCSDDEAILFVPPDTL